MSNRESIAKNVELVLKDMDPPKPAFVTREPFDLQKLAITQFPAILITTGNETREDNAMGGARRSTIQMNIRGYVRADGRVGQIQTVDQKRNELIERIEETLNTDRTRELTDKASTTLVSSIEIIEHTPPLGEFLMICDVRYSFTKGAT
jgi:hypothetical protein